jgi:uncharacterized membrane protein YhaH (DUF805 family)
VVHLLFSGRGRIGRAKMAIFPLFTTGWGLLAASIWLTQFSDLKDAVEDLGWEAILPMLLDPLPHLIATALILVLLVLWCVVARALMVKRLHDCDRSGYWLVLPIVAATAAVALALAPPLPQAAKLAGSTLFAMAAGTMTWFLFELFVHRAAAANNRFGPPN